MEATATTAQGLRLETSTPEQRAAAADRAFDYRGDVTLHLADGRTIAGFVFNRTTGPTAQLELYPTGEETPLRLPLAELKAVEFSGVDTAAGKGWDAWLEKVAKAEADGTIAELYPEELEHS